MSKVQSERMFAQLGKMVVLWNDLELQLKRLLVCLSDDVITVLILSTDMQASALVNAVETMAREYDVHRTKFGQFSKAVSEKTGRPPQTFEPISEHVNCVIACADKLREYRNYYAHGVVTPGRNDPLMVGGITARGGRLDTYDAQFTVAELKRITTLIGQTVRYAERVIKCISARKDDPSQTRPTWPKKLPVPEKLKKPRTSLQDRLPLF